MKTIGIIGAMDEEINLLKNQMEIVSAKNITGVDYFMGKISGKNAVLVRSGIGKVNAAICTQILIDLYGVDYVINIGVAGAINKDLNLGDVIISKDLIYHDFDATAFGYKIGEIPRMEISTFIADENLISLAQTAGKEILKNNNIFVERICSGDKFVSSNEDKNKIWNCFKAYCVEMEGAAIAHTCFLNKLPFVIIRSISDKADEVSTDTYNNFLETAAKNSSDIVLEILKSI